MGGRVLDPLERFSEAAFGLVMVLGFTGSFSAATAGEQDVRELLIGAIGCNLAWGTVDAMMYLIATVAQRGRDLTLLQSMREGPDTARRVLADALPDPVAGVLSEAELEDLRQRVVAAPLPARGVPLGLDDLKGALGVFLLVFLSTLPVVLPFAILDEPLLAMRVSNGIAIALLYVCGHSLGRYAGSRPWLTGLAMVGIGFALVGVTIALGG